VKRTDIAGAQINNEGVTGHLYGNDVAVSTGIYRDRGMQKRQALLPAFYERLAESKWSMGTHCQPIDFDHALIGEDS